ncbi:amino acid ABC transporter substrate-binding protein [Chelonobacter oris]|uniref:Amino acid ABC transporter substrate-binding protein n=2 Tax=Chelonobacter oris TaxID=505317 RepID=A0A0A3BCR1_9PAST|nr:amino acid ABC transporter substrate-binding protein [Chelonobacter oris]
MFKTLLKGITTALLFSAAAHAATLDEIKSRGYMSIATEDNYAPFEIIEGGKPGGFTNDMVAELKAYAPFEVRQEIMPWTGLLPAVTTGKYDAAITGSIVSTERLARFDFAPPIASAQHMAILRANDDSVKTAADLSGKTLGVQAGSVLLTRLPELEQLLKDSGGKLGEVIEYTSYPEAYADLANGRLDYVINSFVPAKTLSIKRSNVFKVGPAVSGAGFHAWAVPKGNESLLGFFTEFLNKMRESGKLAELQEKWFGQAFPDLPTQPITSVEQYNELTVVKEAE